MLVAVAASRFLGLIRDMILAREFAVTGVMSAYTAAFNIPDLLYFFLSSGALSAAFIPVFTERFTTDRKKEAWQIFSIIGCFMGIVLTGAVIVSWIFARPLVSVLAVPGFVHQHPELVPLTMSLTRIILPCQLFFFLGGLMMATLQSRQEFRATAAGPVIYNLGIIFGAVVLSRWFYIRGVAMGTLIGAFAGNIVYAAYWMKRMGFEFYPSLNLRHPGVVRIAKLALPVIFGLGLPQIDVIVNKWFASFVSAGAPAALNFSNRLMQVPLGIFAQAAGTAILPLLAAYAAKNAIDDMRSSLGYGLRGIMVESIPATVFMIVMADPLVRTIYMGKNFLPSMVGPTVVPLIWYCVGIYAWAGQAIVARGFFALQDTITPVVVGTVSTFVFIPLNYILMRGMGTGGIALATSIAVSLHFFGLTVFLRRRLGGIEGKKIVSTVARTMAAAAVMAVICFGVRLGMSRLIGSWQLQDGDLRSPERFAIKLENDHDPLSKYLASRLSPATNRMLKVYVTKDEVPAALPQSLMHDLNKVIKSTNLAVAPMEPEIAERARSGKALARANRRLLEAAYPRYIVKRPLDRVETRMGSLVTVLVAMILGVTAYLGLLRVLKVDEMDYLLSALKRRLTRRRSGPNGKDGIAEPVDTAPMVD